MAGTKRKAPNSSASDGGRTTRSKQAKTDGAGASSPESKSKPKAKRGPKAPATASFKAKAMPLHVNITHTPPAVTDDDKVTAASADPGFIGTSTLIVSDFSTGSYGWKGSKRVTIELPGEDGEKEKVQVMITINATVMGSKNQGEGEATEEGGDVEEKKDAAEEPAEEAEEKADS